MIGVISHDFTFAKNAIKSRGDVEEFNEATGLGTFISRRQFKVCTRPEHLHGVTLSDFIMVGRPEPELVEVAKTRLR